MKMKKYLAIALVALLWSSPVQGDYYQQPECETVCANTEANNYYRFVEIVNATNTYLECRIDASNGAEYHFYLRGNSKSRLFTINDPRAQWSWGCNAYQRKKY